MIFGASRPRRPRPASRSTRRYSDAEAPHEDLPPKLIPSFRALFSTAASLLHTRIALAGIELEEEVQRLIGAAALALVALLLISLALVVGTFTIVLAVDPEHRVATMAGITVLYFIVAFVLVMRLKGIFANRPPIFGATLAELEKDKETLSAMARAHEAAEAARETERARRHDEDAFAPVRKAAPNPTVQGAV
jgi:uncharacterized membrane protein YqjE